MRLTVLAILTLGLNLNAATTEQIQKLFESQIVCQLDKAESRYGREHSIVYTPQTPTLVASYVRGTVDQYAELCLDIPLNEAGTSHAGYSCMSLSEAKASLSDRQVLIKEPSPGLLNFRNNGRLSIDLVSGKGTYSVDTSWGWHPYSDDKYYLLAEFSHCKVVSK